MALILLLYTQTITKERKMTKKKTFYTKFNKLKNWDQLIFNI